MIQSFETIPEATRRTEEIKEKINRAAIKPKDHVGNHASYQWDKTALEQEVVVF